MGQALLAAYRWQYIGSGVRHPHFASLLGSMLNDEQSQRVGTALAPLLL